MSTSHARVFLIDPQPIYRLGMATCLRGLPVVASVADVGHPDEAWAHPALAEADLVMVDIDVPDACDVIARLRREHECGVLAIAVRWKHDELAAALAAGASGVVSKSDLTPSALEAHVLAALHGSGMVPPQLLAGLLADGRNGGPALGTLPRVMTGLTSREQVVLRLIADGRLIREVASELCYSERTVKMVLSNAVNKLGARSRSQAVAHAVREGLI
ncbi:MAG TPA: response regulator transcription factor [Solirubrobacteraceae bacterium]|nr:response regulator transcription factor [Solirubrobacteraceae bacterium]